jgi:hypothetical protein
MCKSVDELRKIFPRELKERYSATKGSAVITSNIVPTVAAGAMIRIGDDRDEPFRIVQSVSGLSVTLESAMTRSYLYGTPAYQKHQYRLWDGNKTFSCVCDDGISDGADCSLRKCPTGDDPLTRKSRDPVSSTDDTPFSEYRQQVESQTIEFINLNNNAHTTGTFKLLFTDEYGQERSTEEIKMIVPLSLKATVTSGSNIATFDFTPLGCDFTTCAEYGLPHAELSVGDYIKVGNQIRRVKSLVMMDSDGTADTNIDSAIVDGELDASITTAGGVVIYRMNVAKEIREAMRQIANQRVGDLSVRWMEAGEKLDQLADTSITTRIDHAATITGGLAVGDFVRVNTEIRHLNSEIVANDNFYVTKLTTEAASQVSFKWNRIRYRIRFETGCGSDEDCNNNGKNSLMSDAGATCHRGGGYCICSSSTYYGPGCTRDGKGTHRIDKGSVFYNAQHGNIPHLKCDTGRLTRTKLLSKTVTVTQDNPSTMAFSSALSNGEVAVGDRVRVGYELRVVSDISDLANIKVSMPFRGWNGTNDALYATDFDFSDSDEIYIFQPSSDAYRLLANEGEGVACQVTDIPQLRSTVQNLGATTVTTSAQNSGTPTIMNRATLTSSGELWDSEEIRIGDRVHFETGTGTWVTRTVDHIYFAASARADGRIGVVGFTVDRDAPFGSSSATGKIFNNQSGTTESAVCGNRGICNEKTGICQCVPGYTGHSCSRQDIYAV